jgi:YegS/Rv2252/BmrU family lipid kinase
MKLPSEQRPILGYIPTGTTNDFSRNLSFPRGTEKTAAVACTGIPRACDLGLANGKWFTYVAAFGLFTDVTYTTPQNVKNLLGHTAYVLEGASRLAFLKSYSLKVESDQFSIEDEFIYGMVGNTVSVGGLLNLSSDLVKLDDGLFEVILVRKPRNAADFQTIFRALTTQIMPEEEGPIIAFRSNRITFSCSEPLPWTLDGEFGGEHATTEIENLPRSIVVACGK